MHLNREIKIWLPRNDKVSSIWWVFWRRIHVINYHYVEVLVWCVWP